MKKIQMNDRTILVSLLSLLLSSCLKETAIPISSSFSIEVAEDKTAPVIIKLQNDSYGADEYEWTSRFLTYHSIHTLLLWGKLWKVEF